MVKKAGSSCRNPSCPGIVRNSVCSVCGPQAQRGMGWDEWHRRRNAESRHVRGYGRNWEKLRAVVLAQEPLCRLCKQSGVTTAATQVDHIIPKAVGGTDDMNNLQPLCVQCHRTKTAREVVYGERMNRAETTVWIITGPPGAGKTTYVREHMQRGDLVLDVDALFAALSGLGWYEDIRGPLLPFVLEARDAVLRRLARPSTVRQAWVITSEANHAVLMRMKEDLGARLFVLEVEAEECLRRIQADERRHNSHTPWATLVREWWATWEATKSR